MSRPISIAIALLVLTAILVLYVSAVDQRDQSAMAPPAASGTARPTIEASEYLSTNVDSRGTFDSPLASSDRNPIAGDTGMTQQQTNAPALSGTTGYSSNAPSTERGLDPAAVAADMSGGGPVAAMHRPPSSGPSQVDRALSGPKRIQQPLAAGTTELEINQPVDSPEMPISLGSGPSQTDLRLPGPGEGEE